MKIKLLKDLPGSKKGDVVDANGYANIFTEDETILSLTYAEQLIQYGFAEEVKEEPKSVWNFKEGDIFYMLFSNGDIEKSTRTDLFKYFNKTGGAFITKEEAEMELLRREARAKAWKPKYGDQYYFEFNGGIDFTEWLGDETDLMYYYNGNCHKTEEEAEKFGRKYGKAFGLN